MEMRAGTFNLKENWKLEAVDAKTGEVLQSEEKCNTIVNTGLARVARLLNGVSSTYFRALGIGIGVVGAGAGDTALGSENQRATATLSNGTYTAVLTHTFTFGGNYAITEAGIFDSDVVSGSTMLARTTFTAKNVSTVINLIVTATITVASA